MALTPESPLHNFHPEMAPIATSDLIKHRMSEQGGDSKRHPLVTSTTDNMDEMVSNDISTASSSQGTNSTEGNSSGILAPSSISTMAMSNHSDSGAADVTSSSTGTAALKRSFDMVDLTLDSDEEEHIGTQKRQKNNSSAAKNTHLLETNKQNGPYTDDELELIKSEDEADSSQRIPPWNFSVVIGPSTTENASHQVSLQQHSQSPVQDVSAAGQEVLEPRQQNGVLHIDDRSKIDLSETIDEGYGSRPTSFSTVASDFDTATGRSVNGTSSLFWNSREGVGGDATQDSQLQDLSKTFLQSKRESNGIQQNGGSFSPIFLDSDDEEDPQEKSQGSHGAVQRDANDQEEDSEGESDDSRELFNYIRERSAAKRASLQLQRQSVDTDLNCERAEDVRNPQQAPRWSGGLAGIVSAMIKEQKKPIVQKAPRVNGWTQIDSENDRAQVSRKLRQKALEERHNGLREHYPEKSTFGQNEDGEQSTHGEHDDLDAASLFGDDDLFITGESIAGGNASGREIQGGEDRIRLDKYPDSRCQSPNTTASGSLYAVPTGKEFTHEPLYDADEEFQRGAIFFQRKYRKLDREKRRARTLINPATKQGSSRATSPPSFAFSGQQHSTAERTSDAFLGGRNTEPRERKKRNSDSWAGFYSRPSQLPLPGRVPSESSQEVMPNAAVGESGNLRVENDIGLLVQSNTMRSPRPNRTNDSESLRDESRSTETFPGLFGSHRTAATSLSRGGRFDSMAKHVDASKAEVEEARSRRLDMNALHNVFVRSATYVFVHLGQNYQTITILENFSPQHIPEKTWQDIKELRDLAIRLVTGFPLQRVPRKRVNDIGRNMRRRLDKAKAPSFNKHKHEATIHKVAARLAGPQLWKKICDERVAAQARSDDLRDRRDTRSGVNGRPPIEQRARKSTESPFRQSFEDSQNRRVSFNDDIEVIDFSDCDEQTVASLARQKIGKSPTCPKTVEQLRRERSERATVVSKRLEEERIVKAVRRLEEFNAASAALHKGPDEDFAGDEAGSSEEGDAPDDISISSDEDETAEDYERRKIAAREQRAEEQRAERMSRLPQDSNTMSDTDSRTLRSTISMKRPKVYPGEVVNDDTSSFARPTVAGKGPGRASLKAAPERSKLGDIAILNRGIVEQDLEIASKDDDMTDIESTSEAESLTATESDEEPTIFLYLIRLTLRDFHMPLHLPKRIQQNCSISEETELPFADSSRSVELYQQNIVLEAFPDMKSAGKVLQQIVARLRKLTNPIDWSKMDATYGVDENAGTQYQTVTLLSGAKFEASIERQEMTWLEAARIRHLKHTDWRKAKTAPSFIYKVRSETWTEEDAADGWTKETIQLPSINAANENESELFGSTPTPEPMMVNSLIGPNQTSAKTRKDVRQQDHSIFHTVAHANEEAANLLLMAFRTKHEEQEYILKTVEEDLVAYLVLLSSEVGSFDRQEILGEQKIGGDGKVEQEKQVKEMMRVWVVEERVWGPRP